MRPGCLVRDRAGYAGRVVSVVSGYASVASLSVEIPDFGGVWLNKRLVARALGDLEVLADPVHVRLANDSAWTVPLFVEIPEA